MVYTDALRLIAELFCNANGCVKGTCLQLDELHRTQTNKKLKMKKKTNKCECEALLFIHTFPATLACKLNTCCIYHKILIFLRHAIVDYIIFYAVCCSEVIMQQCCDYYQYKQQLLECFERMIASVVFINCYKCTALYPKF